jgi:ubiquinol-cytochrome c reductase cytochrome c1 subunit
MKRVIIVLLLVGVSTGVLAAGGGYHLDSANIDLTNKASLQNGARLFVNYCQGCHSAAYQRYNRMGRDIGLDDALVEDNLIFTGAKVGETMMNAMPESDSKRWFGVSPPDLTLIARSRGEDWLYTYLRTFYLDPTRPLGVNNAVFNGVGMPHVLWELQGWQKPVMRTDVDEQGNEHHVIEGFELVQQGSLAPVEFDQSMRDLVTFLAYIAEPIRLEREALGIKVLLFLVVMIVVFYLLKKEYWKDVH